MRETNCRVLFSNFVSHHWCARCAKKGGGDCFYGKLHGNWSRFNNNGRQMWALSKHNNQFTIWAFSGHSLKTVWSGVFLKCFYFHHTRSFPEEERELIFNCRLLNFSVERGPSTNTMVAFAPKLFQFCSHLPTGVLKRVVEISVLSDCF